MYICPICKKEFNSENEIVKHLAVCWKEQHPFHQSKSAPRGKDIMTREINDDMKNFFNSFDKENKKW